MPDRYNNFDPAKLKALKGTIITRQIQNRSVLDSGLILSHERVRYEGEHRVLAVGDDIEDIKPGYVVIVNLGRGHLFEADGEFHNTIKYKEVLGVVYIPGEEKPYFRPIRDNILIKLDRTGERIGSLYMPDVARKDSPLGEVMAVGSYNLTKKKVKIPFNVKVGDKVYAKKGGATPINIFGNEHWLITEDNIVGKYESIL